MTHDIDCDCRKCEWAYDEAQDEQLTQEYENTETRAV